MARMMVYAHFDPLLNETKFGDHFVSGEMTPEEAEQHTIAYMRSQYPRRTRYFDSDEVLKKVWDISDYAKSQNKFYGASKIDDVIRPAIGKPGKQGKEYHALHFDEVCFKVNRFLAKQGQPLITAGLSTKQYEIAEEVLTEFADGNRCVLAELCARYGKTIWSGAVAVEANADLVVVASYVKTVFTSFASDLTSFDQFANYEHIDTGKENYQEKITKALNTGKKVFAYLSLCNGSKRQERIDFLFDQKYTRMLIVDEADFGAHKFKQAKPLIEKIKKIEYTILMTGTNADRAATHWPVDTMVSVTYPELLIQKRMTQKGSVSDSNQLKNFKIDSGRDLLVPDLACYQMDLTGPVEAAIEAGEVDEEFKLLPSWAKFGANPVKAKGFFVRTLESIFLGKGNHDELNVDYQLNESPDQRVAMMFISAKNNIALNDAAKIAQQTLPGYEVIALNGATKHNGRRITNENAEKVVKEIVEQGKPVLILSKEMAARSFSIPEITELYLAYDKGSNGTTIQKMSRTLTPGELDKVGRIFSLSFDPNRDDKFDAMIIETADNYARRSEQTDFREAMRDVLRTIDIFSCTEEGAVKMDIDTYLEQALARKAVSRVLGKVIDITKIDGAIITALANGNRDISKNEKIKAALLGKTKDSKEGNGNGVSHEDNTMAEIAKAREALVFILENLDYLIYGTESTAISETLPKIKDNDQFVKAVENRFGVNFAILEYLFERGAINQKHVELLDLF